MMKEIAVLIPTYNEALTIRKVIIDFKKALPQADIYVYDNNSSDGTDEIARASGAKVSYVYQQGKGNVIRKMFREIEAKCYLVVDGDDTYPAEKAQEMCSLVLNKGIDMVVGDRLSSTYFEENKRKFHNFGNFIVRLSINHLFNTNIMDIMTGYRACSYLFVKSFAVLSKEFEIETEMSIHAADKNMLIENVKINYKNRPEGSQSKLNTLRDGVKVIKMIISLFRVYEPLKFFGFISSCLTVCGSIMFISVLEEYFRIGLVPRFPTLIVSCFLILIGIISFFSGLILATINWKNKQDFEYRLLDIKRKI